MSKPSKGARRLAEQFMLRLPDGMRDCIAEAAQANNRSMNAEIVARLEASFRLGGGADALNPLGFGADSPKLVELMAKFAEAVQQASQNDVDVTVSILRHQKREEAALEEQLARQGLDPVAPVKVKSIKTSVTRRARREK